MKISIRLSSAILMFGALSFVDGGPALAQARSARSRARWGSTRSSTRRCRWTSLSATRRATTVRLATTSAGGR